MSNEIINVKEYMEMLVLNVKEVFTSEVSSVKEQIKHLEDKLITRLDDHENDNAEIIKEFRSEIEKLKGKIKIIDGRVEAIEMKPVKDKAGEIDKFKNILLKVVYTAVATGFLGFITFLLLQYINSF